MTLNEVMTQTADAIREKTGKTELIAPVNFAEEIKSISAGGGESGGSTIEYLDVSGLGELAPIVGTLGIMARFENGGQVDICPPALTLMESTENYKSSIRAVAIDPALEMLAPSLGNMSLQPVLEILSLFGVDSTAIPRITKEQFYTLE